MEDAKKIRACDSILIEARTWRVVSALERLNAVASKRRSLFERPW